MAARKRRKKVARGERVASGIILACLAGIGLAVYLTGHSDRGSGAGAAGIWGDGPELAPAEVASLFRTGIRTFDAENLYEYINGQAPHYIGFGFRALQVVEYSPEGAAIPTLVVDVYEMGQRRNAYGLFMSSLPPEEEVAELGNAGFLSGNVGVFWKGPYYVRVAALTGEDLSAQVEEAALVVADRIEDDSTELREFSVFPSEGLIPDSFAFTKSAAFGLAYLRETFVAEYEGEEVYYRLFYADLEDASAAMNLLEEHAEFLRSSDGLQTVRLDEEEGEVWGRDRYVGPTLMLARGHVVAGSTGLSDLAQAEEIVSDLLKRAVRVLDEEEGDSHGEE